MIPESAQAPPLEAVRDFAARRPARPRARRPSSSSPSTSTTASAPRSSRPSAGCRGTASRAPRPGSSRASRPRWSRPLQDPITLVELGCGSGEKLALLAEALRGRRKRVLVHLIDISPDALELSERTLGALEHVSVVGHRATYEVGLRHAARERPAAGTMLVALPRLQHRQLRPPGRATSSSPRSAAASGPGDALLLGADLVKPESELLLAYDDPLGVTAAFNKNLLARMNTELLADFDLSAFAHRAVWNPIERRVEMHLESLARPDRPHPPGGVRRRVLAGRADLDRELLQVRRRRGRAARVGGRLPSPPAVDRARRAVRARAIRRRLRAGGPRGAWAARARGPAGYGRRDPAGGARGRRSRARSA